MTVVKKLADVKENQRYPDIALNKSKMAGIKMSHKEAVISENDGGKEGARLRDR
jgi:hypothetical protein